MIHFGTSKPRRPLRLPRNFDRDEIGVPGQAARQVLAAAYRASAQAEGTALLVFCLTDNPSAAVAPEGGAPGLNQAQLAKEIR